MAFRSPARFLAPLALAAAILAVFLIVQGSVGGDGAQNASPPAAATTPKKSGSAKNNGTGTSPNAAPPATGTSTTPAGGRTTYTVRPGDTFGTIAAATGVTADEIQALNPTADPNSLTVGQKLRIAR
jgi:LysM repeat protein